jgi:hypothetical protein
MTLAAVFLIVTGLLGYEPYAHMSLDPATWRRGTVTDPMVWRQIALGVALLIAAGLVALRINRRFMGRRPQLPRDVAATIRASFNGRTAAFGAADRGSHPRARANLKSRTTEG